MDLAELDPQTAKVVEEMRSEDLWKPAFYLVKAGFPIPPKKEDPRKVTDHYLTAFAGELIYRYEHPRSHKTPMDPKSWTKRWGFGGQKFAIHFETGRMAVFFMLMQLNKLSKSKNA